ncbi:WD40 repeat domain-containing protein [Nonomuraea sp. NPDC005650]|uniref:WD40 repeat domain-containing protein n=1 Tax=Nonomuraea sp. NPDC005650 TaxID=3157045 RepID=UPI0033BF5D46
MIRSLLLPGTLSAALLLATVSAAPAAARPLGDRDVNVPEVGVVLHERDGDPWRVTAVSKEVSPSHRAAYLRSADGISFRKKKGYDELVPAPKGGRVAGVPYSSPGAFDSVVVFDDKGKAKRIRTVRKPLSTAYPAWTRDGRKLVLSIRKDGITTVGFVIVDPVTGTSKAVTVRGIDQDAAFQWTPDGRYLAANAWDQEWNVRVIRPDGRTHRTLRKVGIMHGADAFSPSGKRLLTLCLSMEASNFCVWDFTSGKLVKRVNDESREWTIGWWDDRHLATVVRDEGEDARAVVTDLNGDITRVLATFSAKAGRGWVDLVYTPSR